MFDKKLWIKFDELDIECFCESGDKDCPPEAKPKCREYVVRFIEIERSEAYEDRVKAIKDATKIAEDRLKRNLKKFETEIQKNLRKMKKFKI